MATGVSNSMRVFRGCMALMAQSKSSVAAPEKTASVAATAGVKSKATPKAKTQSKAKNPTSSLTSSSNPTATTTLKPKIRKESTRPSGILKVVQVSAALGNFLGVPEASRTHAVKQIWSYIKLHNLQNPANKREIYCDEKLKTIFDGRERVGFLEIGKLLARHFIKSD